jgi:hypothetical protein
MDEYETLNHTTWDCKYHIVFIPKYRRKVLYKEPLAKITERDEFPLCWRGAVCVSQAVAGLKRATRSI